MDASLRTAADQLVATAKALGASGLIGEYNTGHITQIELLSLLSHVDGCVEALTVAYPELVPKLEEILAARAEGETEVLLFGGC